MPNEAGEWIMTGLDYDDPRRIKNHQELISVVNQVGFLPLFANEVKGFSVEEWTSNLFWWTGDPLNDPWYWRELIARSGEVFYGKFFHKKAGFISKEWFPVFANYRRDGYDFDSRWDDELASMREKKIFDLFSDSEELYSYEIKKLAGFSKDGEKNFDGTITDMQMQGYLVVRDFRRKKRKKDGVEYGWPVSVYTTPENMIPYEEISKAYKDEPSDSFEQMIHKILLSFPNLDENALRKLMK